MSLILVRRMYCRSCEFVAELHDFLKEDISRLYPALASRTSISLIETGKELQVPHFNSEAPLMTIACSLIGFQNITIRFASKGMTA